MTQTTVTLSNVEIEAEWQALDRLVASGGWPSPWQLRRWRDLIGQMKEENERLRQDASDSRRTKVPPPSWSGPKEDF
jgi:hypothetical protein